MSMNLQGYHEVVEKSGFTRSGKDFNKTDDSIQEDIEEQDNDVFIPGEADNEGVMMFMQTMKDKIDFMKTRLADLESRFERKLDGESKILRKAVD